MIYIELIHVRAVKSVSRLNFLLMNVQLLQHHMLEDHSFSTVLCYTFFNNQLTIYVDPFLGSLFHCIDLYVYTCTNANAVLFMADLYYNLKLARKCPLFVLQACVFIMMQK